MSNKRELQDAYANIMHAVSSEFVFGSLTGQNKEEQLQKLKSIYRRIMKVVHSDRYQDDLDAIDLADEATARLNELFERAKKKIEYGTYGKEGQEYLNRTMLETESGLFYVDFSQPVAEGDIAFFFAGNSAQSQENDEEGQVLVKLVDDPANNDLMNNEIRILKIFEKKPGPQNKHLPVIIDSFTSKTGQVGTIIREFDVINFPEIIEFIYPEGVPTIHAVWMMSRILSALGFVHKRKVVHCNIAPEHFIVLPKSHNVFILDWCYASYMPFQTNGAFKAVNEPFSPPEVLEGKIPSTSADLFSLGKCMIYLLGGNPETNEMPDHVDDRFRRFVELFVRESPIQRPRDAWEMWEQLTNLRQEMFGNHVFLEFDFNRRLKAEVVRARIDRILNS